MNTRLLWRLATALLVLSIVLSLIPPGLNSVSALTKATRGGFLYAWDGEKKTGSLSNPHDGKGVDFLTTSGSQEYPVLAPKDGVVVDYFDDFPETPQATCGGNSRSLFVNYILLGHGPFEKGKYDHYTLIYHFKPNSIPNFAANEYVELGKFIGTAGNTGKSDANHVHMEVSIQEPGLNTSRSYNCNGANIAVAKHRNNVDSNTISYGFEEQANQWPIEGGATNALVGDSYNWEGIASSMNLVGGSNVRYCSANDDVRLYNHINYGGECLAVIDPSQTANVPTAMHVSSIYLKPSWVADHTYSIYNESDLGGNKSTVLLSSVANLGDLNWNDQVKSTHNSYTGNSWLTTFSIADNPPLEADIHVVVQDQGDFDAMRVCFNGMNCQETAATELYYTWPTYLESTGDYLISVQYRRDSDNQDWNNADKIEYAYHLNVNPSYTACGSSVEGATLVSGLDCVKVVEDVSDLALGSWAGRSNTYIQVTGDYEAWVYDSPNYLGIPQVVKSGQNLYVGSNVTSIDLKPLSPNPLPNPTGPFTADANTVHLWHMNEFDGGTIHDAVGTLNGTKTDAVAWITNDLGYSFDKALLFPNLPNGRGITFPVMENICPFTWEGWISAPSESLGGNVAGQLAGGGNTGVNKWLVSVNTRRPQVEVWSGNGSQIAYSYKEVVSGAWNYLMFTYDCNNSVKLYLNNELVGEVTTAGVWSSTPTTYEIGSGEGIYRYYGAIDEVRISNAVRVPTAENTWDGGLLANGSFESLTSGWANNWTRNNTNSVVIDTGSNGTHGSNSLRFLSDTSNHSAKSAEILVSPANSYTWQSRVRSTSGSGEFGFYIDEFDSGHNWISGQWFSVLPASVEGTKIINYKPTSSSVAYAGLQYYMIANTSYEVYVDSVSFTQSTSANLVTNGGFENLLGGWADAWTRDNMSFITVNTSSQGNEGTNSLHFSPPSSNVHAVATRFPVGSGTYTWSQYVVTTSGTGEFSFYIHEFDATGNWISGQWKGGIWGASNGVQSFTYTRSSSNVAFASPQLYVLSGTTFDVYVDSVYFGQ